MRTWLSSWNCAKQTYIHAYRWALQGAPGLVETPSEAGCSFAGSRTLQRPAASEDSRRHHDLAHNNTHFYRYHDHETSLQLCRSRHSIEKQEDSDRHPFNPLRPTEIQLKKGSLWADRILYFDRDKSMGGVQGVRGGAWEGCAHLHQPLQHP